MATKKIKSFQDILDIAGGSMELALSLGCGQTAVLNWKRAGIPRKYWPDLVRIYKFNPEDLYEIDETLRDKTP